MVLTGLVVLHQIERSLYLSEPSNVILRCDILLILDGFWKKTQFRGSESVGFLYGCRRVVQNVTFEVIGRPRFAVQVALYFVTFTIVQDGGLLFCFNAFSNDG